jgi:hypothetical protein
VHIIIHRVNTIALLEKIPENFGVEIDIRSYGENLIIHHDPFKKGELFEDWIKLYNHGTLILNVKEEGLENSILKLMIKYNIEDFFFLDQSFPFLRKTAIIGESRCAVRVSEYESIETVLSLSGKVDWVWVDCFTRFPLYKDEANLLRDSGFKLCIVSPELQGRKKSSDVREFRRQIEQLGIEGDAVCTKYTDLWS